jgi:hypothetical protein
MDATLTTMPRPWRVQETVWHNGNGSTYILGQTGEGQNRRSGRQVLVARVFAKLDKDGDPAAADQRLKALAAQVAATPVLIAALRLAVDAGTLPAEVEQAARDALAALVLPTV